MIFEGTLGKLADHLGVPNKNPLVVEQPGRVFEVRYIAGSKNRSAKIRVTVTVDEVEPGARPDEGRACVAVRPAVIFRVENGSDRLGKRLKLNREVQTGDAEFDRAVYVETDSPEEDVRAVLANDEFRVAVRGLLNTGVASVVLDPAGLSATYAIGGRGTSEGERVDGAMALLGRAATALPLFERGRARKPANRALRDLPLIAAGVVIAVLFALTGSGPLDGGAKIAGFGGGLALAVFAIVLIVSTLSGRSDSLRRVANMSLAALLFIPVLSYECVCWVNRHFDASPPIEHATTITRTWAHTSTSSHNRSSTSYHVDVASWRPGETTVSLSVSSQFFGGATVGRAVVVDTHPGKLGWEWVEGFRYR